MSAKRKVKHKARPAAVPVDLLLATGSKAQTVGDLPRAEDAFRRVLAADPKNEMATQLLGAILVDRGDIDEALERFETVAELLGEPTIESYGFFNNYANALRRGQKLKSAEEILRKLTELAPREWQAWHNLAQTLRDLESLDEAAAAMRRAVLLEPNFGPNHGVLGEILHRLGRLHSADASLRRAIALSGHADHSVMTVLGNNLRLLGRLDESLDAVMQSLALSGGHPTAHSNAGVVLMQLGRFDESVEHFQAALAAEPENNQWRGYRAYTLFAAGRLEEAFDDWEAGVHGGPRGNERNTIVPHWKRDETDVRVMIYREQGVGDEIMMASMYDEVISTAREVVIECDTRLIPLFTRSFPQAEVRAQTHKNRFEEGMTDYDRAMPAGSLMKELRRNVADFPERRSFLVPDPEKVAAWKAKLAEIADGPFVGLSWRSQIKTAERRLEYTRLDEWGELFAVEGITWINLQYDDCDRELHDAEQRFGVKIHRWPTLDLMNDFDEVAALNVNLDLVVAPFNATAMLSASLGVPTVAMGNRHSWSEMGTDRVPFVPAIEPALRVPPEEWDSVLAQAARRVGEIAANARSHV